MRISLVFVILLLFCVAGVCAESQIPVPIGAETTNKPQPQPKTSQTKTGNKKIATDIQSRIEISKAPIIQVETVNKSEIRRDYSSSEWYLVYLTFILAAVTLGLAIYTAKLYHATVKLGEDAKDTSTRQAIEMERSLAISKEAAEAAKKTAEVAEKAMILTERPYVFVSNVSRFQRDAIDGRYFVTYEVSNHGRTPADIDDIRAEISNQLEGNIDTPMFVDSDNRLYLSPILGVGETMKEIREVVPSNLTDFNPQWDGLTPAYADDIYFRVIIKYRGVIEEVYEDSFFWWYDRSAKAFAPRKDTGYYYKKKYPVLG